MALAAAQTDSAAVTEALLEVGAEDQDTKHRGKTNSQPMGPPVELPHGADPASDFVPMTAP